MNKQIKYQCQTLLVTCLVALSAGDSRRTEVKESEYVPRISRDMKLPLAYTQYAFKPRAIPLRSEAAEERSVYYTEDNKKQDVLFPGNYFPIAEEKKENQTEFNPTEEGPFRPVAIPLLREDLQRSLNTDEEPIIERPEGFVQPSAQRRSLSYIFGIDEEDDDVDRADDEDEEEDENVDIDSKGKLKPPKIKVKSKKLTRYMLPLLLAYKLKYFALIPLMIGGLVLLVGSTGLAGFFFALFAAVMTLQKTGNY